ncbi:DUF551 domain-containing protein [Providencia rettgeri]|uniref:DUF551 domain-containing protein n=1 Tax=Providencia rettgeri TaxID=587 RepID=UPI0019D10FBE|nr:DUF551 domain-containing protein [Providencia rettgeri]ELR5224444.1 DUF551 domain-containing protein [Providencia rettgeri]MBN6363930.1 DUF551 domain-containing protein [Providencia rettgeri]MBQ0306879.1 DUF551 domain-containing protein [Providencia rettgeri]MDX7322319.1 DUF551 domain-containing protein [Providencia rettgeri]HEM7186411.1 DUF551 domain-containing protein [Providencia rettgeri]
MQGTNWVKVIDRLPETGEPVLLVYAGVIQHLTYFLSSYDCAESYRWFPYAGNMEFAIPFKCVSHWIYVKDLPLPPVLENK